MPPDVRDEGYHILVNRSTGALIVEIAGGLSVGTVNLNPPDAEGGVITANPMLAGGRDPGGLVRALRVGTDGQLKVVLSSAEDSIAVVAASLPLPAGASTAANQATLIAKDFATQTTLAAVLAKITADPATQTTLAALLTELQAKADLNESQPTLNTPVGASKASTGALAASLVAKASPGTFLAVFGTNTLGSAQFIQVHDSATLPADGAVPAMCITAGASNNFFIEIPDGAVFANGITVCNSSTAATKTIGAADCLFTVIYR